jgi:glycosyltransferase involved in cell wall biosynthesis
LVSIAEMGARDVLKDGIGVWIAQENLADFSGKVVSLLQHGQMRRELGNGGRDYANEWSAKRQAQRMLTFYNTLIAPA